MEATKKERVALILKWSPACLLAASLLAVLSLWFVPFSVVYVGTAAVIGLAYTTLTLICWKLEMYQPVYWLVFVPTIFLLVRGINWAEEWAFPDHRFEFLGWWLSIQYICIVFAVFFAVVSILKAPIKRFLFGNIGSPEPPM